MPTSLLRRAPVTMRLSTGCLSVRAAVFAVGLLLGSPQTTYAEPAQVQRLRYDPLWDVTVTGTATALAISLEVFSPSLAPNQCRWCDRDSQGNDTLNGFDAGIRRTLRWDNTTSARRASNLFSYVLAPLAATAVGAVVATHDSSIDAWPVDFLIVAEATMLSVNVNQLTKFVVARERPDVHARTPELRASAASDGDNLSFYSGHTSVAFAIATSAGTVATMRRYRLAPLVWASGFSLALVSGYLRIAADRHYATDVLAGAVFGSLIGFAVPYLGHPVDDRPIVISPSLGASSLVLSGTW